MYFSRIRMYKKALHLLAGLAIAITDADLFFLHDVEEN